MNSLLERLRRGENFRYVLVGLHRRLRGGNVPLRRDNEWQIASRAECHWVEAIAKIAAGIDPSAQKQAQRVAQADTFEKIAREWFANFA